MWDGGRGGGGGLGGRRPPSPLPPAQPFGVRLCVCDVKTGGHRHAAGQPARHGHAVPAHPARPTPALGPTPRPRLPAAETFGEIPNGSSWAITTKPFPELDETHLVVGRVVQARLGGSRRRAATRRWLPGLPTALVAHARGGGREQHQLVHGSCGPWLPRQRTRMCSPGMPASARPASSRKRHVCGGLAPPQRTSLAAPAPPAGHGRCGGNCGPATREG